MKPATNKAIILFDGVCNLCNSSIQFVLKHDKNHHYIFAALQSDVAKELLLHKPKKISKKDSILLIQNNKIYSESTAILYIAKHFTGFWKVLQIFWIVPKFIRDTLYRYIAIHRYQWFGKKEQCMIPTEEVKKRFL